MQHFLGMRFDRLEALDHATEDRKFGYPVIDWISKLLQVARFEVRVGLHLSPSVIMCDKDFTMRKSLPRTFSLMYTFFVSSCDM